MTHCLYFQINVMTTTTGEKSTNDGQANDQDLDFLASAFEEVATADETDLLASVDPSLVSHFFLYLHNIFPSFRCGKNRKIKRLRFFKFFKE